MFVYQAAASMPRSRRLPGCTGGLRNRVDGFRAREMALPPRRAQFVVRECNQHVPSVRVFSTAPLPAVHHDIKRSDWGCLREWAMNSGLP